MRLFWQKGRKIRSTERFKTSAILNARFRESYFKLKVDGRAVTSQTDQTTRRPQGNRLGKMSSSNNIKRISKQHIGMKLLFSSWAFVYFPLVIASFSSLVRCVAFRSFVVVFTLAFTTGQTSSGSLPFIGCFIFPVQPCLFHHNVTIKKVSSFQFNRLAISWPPWVRVWVWASCRFLPFIVFFSWLALLFLELYRSFTMYE